VPAALFGGQALIRSKSGADTYYVREYKYENEDLIFRECTGANERKVKRQNFIVVNSEEICTQVSFIDQFFVLQKIVNAANQETNLASKLVFTFNPITKIDSGKLNDLIKMSRLPVSIEMGNMFRINFVVDKVEKDFDKPKAGRMALDFSGKYQISNPGLIEFVPNRKK